MIAKASIGIVAVAGLCFGGSFLGTVATRSQSAPTVEPPLPSPVVSRLNLDPEQAKDVEARDPQFAEDFRTLRHALEDARSALAATFEDANAADERIREQVEAVIAAHNRLERRVAEYLIAVRDHLTPRQQKKLFGLCAERVRECGRRWRCGRGAGARPDEIGKPRERRGRGRGHGRGTGRD